jgi:hypothetical protein
MKKSPTGYPQQKNVRPHTTGEEREEEEKGNSSLVAHDILIHFPRISVGL